MTQANRLTSLLIAAATAASLMPSLPAFAGAKDIELLQSYAGDWRGRGTFEANGTTETVVCKLAATFTQGTKLQYDGRCTVAGGNMAIHGTMAYVAANNRYEALMSSNTQFTGQAIGKRRGDNIDFRLRQIDPDSGQTVDIDVVFALSNGKMQVDFTITDIASGNKNVAHVPFEKS